MIKIIKKILPKKLKKIIYDFFISIVSNENYYIDLKLGKLVRKYRLVNNQEGYLIAKSKNNYLTYHLRPKFNDDFKSESSEKVNFKTGILIQGPLSNDINFEINTIKNYLKLFKSSEICVSTWNDPRVSQLNYNLDKFKNVHFVINKIPNDSNFNLSRNTDKQTFCTYNGLKYLKNLGIEYVIKSRTDWRIYKPNSLIFLKSLLDTFPVKKNKISKKRIISTSMMSLKFSAYELSDTLQFGHIDDLLQYWDKEYMIHGLKKMNFDHLNNIRNNIPVISNIFLTARYLDKIGFEINWSLENWWQSLVDYFCVIDAESLDVVWTKYHDWKYEKRFYKNYDAKSSRSIEFLDWLSLYSNGVDAVNWKEYGYQEKWELKNNKFIQKDLL